MYRLIIRQPIYFCLVSESEGLPNSVIEAIGSNTLSLISDIPQHRELQSLCPDLIETLPLSKEFNGPIFNHWLSRLLHHFERFNKNPIFNTNTIPQVLSERTMVNSYNNFYYEFMNKKLS